MDSLKKISIPKRLKRKEGNVVVKCSAVELRIQNQSLSVLAYKA